MDTSQRNAAESVNGPVPHRPRLDVGSVLSRTVSTTLQNPAVFLGVVVLASLPAAFIAFSAGSGEMGIGSVIGQLVQVILGMIAQGAVAYGVFQVLRNRPVAIGDALSHGTANLVSLVVASILIGLGVGLGTMLLIVPGLILMCIWAVTIPVCVVEKLGPIESMKRSGELTKGCRWPIFGLVLLLAVLGVIFDAVFTAIVGAVSGSIAVAAFAGVLFAAIPQAFNCVMIAIVYYDLRSLKENISLESLANVFD